MPKRSLPATGEAISTDKVSRRKFLSGSAVGLASGVVRAPEANAHRDAELLRLEAEFNTRYDQWDEASAKTAELEEKFDRITSRLRAKIREAEGKEERAGEAISRLFFRVMRKRAKGLEGMLAKVRIRKRWNADDDESERTILKSLVQDLEGMAGPTTTD
jgi:hypothetical protein